MCTTIPLGIESIYLGLKVYNFGKSYLAEQFRQIKRSVVELFRQIKRTVAELLRQIKRSVAEPQMEMFSGLEKVIYQMKKLGFLL